MKFLNLTALMLASAVAVGAQQYPAQAGPKMPMGSQAPAGTPVPGDDKIAPGPVTLTGCVAAGDKKDTFMLSNVHRVDTAAATTGGTPNAHPSGHAMMTPDANVVYWLDSPAKLRGHVGHQVTIEGTLDEDVDKSKVKVKADGKTQVTTERTKSVKAPAGSATGAAMASGGTETKRLTYKVKVASVTMTADTCTK
ncbi:MAG TPA: hypothetical protein VNJ03_00660 [Vicinamibacterales bacterium]|nr:hypothetical protein [Vicinamibacterales bacterium]